MGLCNAPALLNKFQVLSGNGNREESGGSQPESTRRRSFRGSRNRGHGRVACISCDTGQFNSHVEPTVLTGEAKDDIFEVVPKVKGSCFSRFSGTMKTKVVTEITIHPTYSNCVFDSEAGEVAGSVDTLGCNFKITGLTVEDIKEETRGATTIECSGTNVVKITVPMCTVIIPPQTPARGSDFTNVQLGETSEWDFKLSPILADIEFTSSGIFCPFYGIPKSGKEAEYLGLSTMKGYEDKGGPTNEDEYTEGKQVGIWVTTE